MGVVLPNLKWAWHLNFFFFFFSARFARKGVTEPSSRSATSCYIENVQNRTNFLYILQKSAQAILWQTCSHIICAAATGSIVMQGLKLYTLLRDCTPIVEAFGSPLNCYPTLTTTQSALTLLPNILLATVIPGRRGFLSLSV
jgi:hypothetical protein